MPILSYLYRCIFACVFFVACGVYSFHDSSIPPEVKTIRVENFMNRAAIVNAGLANNLTNEFKNKIQQQTKLILTSEGQADYEVSAYVSNYDIATSGISGTQVSQNQLTLTLHVSFINNLEEQLPDVKSFETSLSLTKQYSSQLSLQQAEQSILGELTTEMVNLMFNKIFSNW